MEYKSDVVTVARRGQIPIPEVPGDFDISELTILRWMHQANFDDSVKDGSTSAEQHEVVTLRRDMRRSEMENEILRCAEAHFAKDALPR